MTRLFSVALVLPLALGLGSACSVDLNPAPQLIHARFDPEKKVIPMPTDVLRDAAAQKLNLPIDDTLTDAEKDFYTYMNQLDGWSSAMTATVDFTAPIALDSMTDDTLQVWEWGGVPQRVTDATVTLAPDGQRISIDAPRTGWKRATRYVILVRGGEKGVRGPNREPVECDAAFYFLRLTQRLDVPEHERAFPGATRAERMENAHKLEVIREDLAPAFDYFEANGIPRTEVAALWAFTVTSRTELAMDKASQRMPLPMDILLDPTTGKVDLPPAKWDSKTVVEAKHRLRTLDGFGTSAHLLFELTGPVDPTTITPTSIRLYEMSTPPKQIPAHITLMADKLHVIVLPDVKPLKEKTKYAVVVDAGVKDAAGLAVIPMPVGHFLAAQTPIAVAGKSQIGAVADEDAARVEGVRQELSPFLDSNGRSGIIAAWPFTTLSVTAPLHDAVTAAERLNVPVTPQNVMKETPGAAAADFPLGVVSLFNVDSVYTGTIQSPYFLDKTTRGWREDGGYEIQNVDFMMTMPKNLKPGQKVPVVIFGHAIMTERRFVLAVADALASRGFAAISIDFPFHGKRTYCSDTGPLSVPDPTTGKLSTQQPCASGTTCASDGRCVDANGKGNALTMWPIVNFPVASGATFIEIEHIANTRDHFVQSVIDLGSLSRSLHTADWQSVVGYPLDTDHVHYAGQSLGGIIGGTYVAISPEIDSSVLNVPGADTVDLFSDSPFFGGQVKAFFTREGVADGTFDQERFLDVARWFMDGADPQGVATTLMENRKVMIQMATLDMIIPNKYTEVLQTLSGAPRRDYIAEHAFLVIPIEPEYLPGVNDMADFLAGRLVP